MVCFSFKFHGNNFRSFFDVVDVNDPCSTTSIDLFTFSIDCGVCMDVDQRTSEITWKISSPDCRQMISDACICLTECICAQTGRVECIQTSDEPFALRPVSKPELNRSPLFVISDDKNNEPERVVRDDTGFRMDVSNDTMPILLHFVC
jgi:hypothetical protein